MSNDINQPLSQDLHSTAVSAEDALRSLRESESDYEGLDPALLAYLDGVEPHSRIITPEILMPERQPSLDISPGPLAPEPAVALQAVDPAEAAVNQAMGEIQLPQEWIGLPQEEIDALMVQARAQLELWVTPDGQIRPIQDIAADDLEAHGITQEEYDRFQQAFEAMMRDPMQRFLWGVAGVSPDTINAKPDPMPMAGALSATASDLPRLVIRTIPGLQQADTPHDEIVARQHTLRGDEYNTDIVLSAGEPPLIPGSHVDAETKALTAEAEELHAESVERGEAPAPAVADDGSSAAPAATQTGADQQAGTVTAGTPAANGTGAATPISALAAGAVENDLTLQVEPKKPGVVPPGPQAPSTTAAPQSSAEAARPAEPLNSKQAGAAAQPSAKDRQSWGPKGAPGTPGLNGAPNAPGESKKDGPEGAKNAEQPQPAVREQMRGPAPNAIDALASVLAAPITVPLAAASKIGKGIGQAVQKIAGGSDGSPRLFAKKSPFQEWQLDATSRASDQVSRMIIQIETLAKDAANAKDPVERELLGIKLRTGFDDLKLSIGNVTDKAEALPHNLRQAFRDRLEGQINGFRTTMKDTLNNSFDENDKMRLDISGMLDRLQRFFTGLAQKLGAVVKAPTAAVAAEAGAAVVEEAEEGGLSMA